MCKGCSMCRKNTCRACFLSHACTHTRAHAHAHAHVHAHAYTHMQDGEGNLRQAGQQGDAYNCTYLKHIHTRTHACTHMHQHICNILNALPLTWGVARVACGVLASKEAAHRSTLCLAETPKVDSPHKKNEQAGPRTEGTPCVCVYVCVCARLWGRRVQVLLFATCIVCACLCVCIYTCVCFCKNTLACMQCVLCKCMYAFATF